jgi:hypothetical protein
MTVRWSRVLASPTGQLDAVAGGNDDKRESGQQCQQGKLPHDSSSFLKPSI